MTVVPKILIYAVCISVVWRFCFGLNCYTNTDIDTNGPVIVTKTGAIVGRYITVVDKVAPAFLGIPFAEPPVGEKRFKITRPILTWNGILYAREKSPTCMQYSTREVGWIPKGLKTSEDCLYLNVWLPANCCCNRSNKLPVMLWLFSGGFYAGSGMMDIYDGDVLSTLGDVIVVTINYRLSVFGFLNLDSKEAPGNQGLYDQYLSMLWVRENIEYFGGDPNSVTLFGESAGSISVSLQLTSPYPRNLFHKAILESGNAYQAVKVDSVKESLNKAVTFSKALSCSIDNSTESSLKKDLLSCFMSKPAIDLSIADNYYTSQYPLFLAPSYGNKCKDCLKYFSEPPMNTIRSGELAQIPTLLGVNQNEGTLFLSYAETQILKRDQNPLLNVPVAKKILQDVFGLVLNPYGMSTINVDRVFNYYYEKVIHSGPDAPLYALSELYGDYIIKCGHLFLADHLKDAYFYFYTHRSRKDTDAEWLGVPHFSEVPYVFGKPIKDTQNYTVEDKLFSEDIIQKWTSFAHLGYPVTKGSEPNWPRYSSSDRIVYELNPRRMRTIYFPSRKACDELWSPIFEVILKKELSNN